MSLKYHRIRAERAASNATAAAGLERLRDRWRYGARARESYVELAGDPQALEQHLAWLRRIGAPAALLKHLSALLGKGKTARAELLATRWLCGWTYASPRPVLPVPCAPVADRQQASPRAAPVRPGRGGAAPPLCPFRAPAWVFVAHQRGARTADQRAQSIPREACCME